MFRYRALLAQKRANSAFFLSLDVTLRRAAALIDGLLTRGRNRKKSIANLLRSDAAGRPEPCRRTRLMIRRLIVPLTAAVVTFHAGHVLAQTPFPAPLPNQSAAPANASPFPPVNGVAAAPVQSAAPVSGSRSGS